MPRIVLPGEPLVEGATALRPWRDSDMDAIVAACQDPEIARWTPVPMPYRQTDARAFLLQRYEAMHAGASAPFAVVASDSGEMLGSVALNRPDWQHARAEVGYWLAREARGQGHATRAVRLIAEWGFRTFGLERLDLQAATGNAASQAVAERVGFTREALLRSYMRGPEGRDSMVVFGLLRSDRSSIAQ